MEIRSKYLIPHILGTKKKNELLKLRKGKTKRSKAKWIRKGEKNQNSFPIWIQGNTTANDY